MGCRGARHALRPRQRPKCHARLPVAVADAHSADTAYYYEHVFNVGGNLLSDVEDQFEWPSGRALFLHDVQVPEHLRRRGYGSLLVADAILTLASDGTTVFPHQGPIGRDVGESHDVARLRSETENTRFLSSLGFVPFRDHLWVLDLATMAGNEALSTIRHPARTAGRVGASFGRAGGLLSEGHIGPSLVGPGGMWFEALDLFGHDEDAV